MGFIYVFLLDYFYLLDIKIEVYCTLFIIKDKVTQVSSEWPVLSDLVWDSGGNVHSTSLNFLLRRRKGEWPVRCGQNPPHPQHFDLTCAIYWVFPNGSVAKNLPAMQEMQV